jgi:hypothetical protein
MLFSTLKSLPAFALLLLVSENVLSVTAAPSGYRPRIGVVISARSPTGALFERGVTKPNAKKQAAAKASQPWKASHLKTSDYRKTALNNNAGSYVQTAGGSQVKYQKGAKGDAEHVIEPGAHVKGPLNQLGVPKNHPVVADLKKALNHKDNLSMLNPASNKAKAQLTADPNRQPKHGASAQHYMQQPDIKQKASATMKRIEAAGKKHQMNQLSAAIKANVKKNWGHIKRDEVDLDLD